MTNIERAYLIGFIKAAGLSPASVPGATAATPTANSSSLTQSVPKITSSPVTPKMITNPTTPKFTPRPRTPIAPPDIYTRIKQNEGFRSNVYNDSLDKATIGYGSTDPKLLKMKSISEPAAAKSLTNHVNQVMQNTANSLGTAAWDRTPLPIQDSLVDLGYQTGSLSKWPKLTEAVQQQDYQTAIQELINSKVQTQTPNRNAQRIKLIQDYIDSQRQQPAAQ